ncbi:MAG TPA: YihY/virulence factor BrkB family protein [Planctomycetota bacterium]|nr:YihY/virulence factor BrkB family protein [Planctomycetota bacterium]
MKPRELFERARKFIFHDLWTLNPTQGWRGVGTYLLRTGVLVVENSINRELFVRAAALTYQVVFSIIPLFAVMLALFKSFGGLERMVDQVRDFLLTNLAPNIGEQVIRSMKDMIERMDARAISIVGFLVLLYTSVSLLSTIEQAFNRIWGVRTPRGLMRRVTVYWTLLTFGPVTIAVSLGVTGFVRNQTGYRWILDNVPFAGVTILTLAPLFLTWLVFAGVYKIMPNTRVSWRAALWGAILAGTAWEVMKRLYMLFNSNLIASYEVYGSLAAIPIFLLWIYASWCLVLLGAEIAFAAQHVRTYRREVNAPKLSHAFKERLSIHLMVEIARDFVAGRDPGTAEVLAERLKVPVRAANEVLYQLAEAKLLREVVNGQTTTFLPSEDLERITVRRIVDALRRRGDDPAIAPAEERNRVEKLFEDTDRAAVEPLEKVTLRELAEGGKG